MTFVGIYLIFLRFSGILSGFLADSLAFLYNCLIILHFGGFFRILRGILRGILGAKARAEHQFRIFHFIAMQDELIE